MPNPAWNEVTSGAPFADDKLLRYLRDAEMSHPETEYRREGMEDYRFYAGKQDTAEVKAALAAQKRPNSTYNEVKPKIDMLVGLAAQTKHQPQVIPVGTEDEALAELMGFSVTHFAKKIKLGRKELDCFEHTVKSGRSLLHFYIDKENPFEPKICAKRFAGRDFFLDPQSVEYDMSDARHLFLQSWLPEDEVKSRWPQFDISAYSSYVTGYGSADYPVFHNEARNLYRIIECWYYELVDAAWFINPLNGQVENLPPKDFRTFAKALQAGLPLGPGSELIKVPVPEMVLSKKKQYKYKIFSGNFVIEEGDSPYKFEGYPSVLYGAYKDEDTNAWFSVIKMMKDPQRAVNTMRRQLQHLLQTLPKGILKHEVGAVLNIEEYETNSASPSFHLEVSEGKIDKVKFEQQPQISPIYSSFGVECSQSMKDSSGIQNEMMGVQTTSREPGVTVRARQETNLAVLYTLYDNFRESRMQGSRILLSFIQQFVTGPQHLRIHGQKGAQLIQINTQLNPQMPGFNDITAGKYDLEVDETLETSTSRAAMLSMLEEFSRNNPGVIPADVIFDYSDLPYSIKQRIRESQASQSRAQAIEADRTYMLELLKIHQKVDATETDAALSVLEMEINKRKQEATGGKAES